VDQPRSSVGLRLRASALEVSGDVTAEARGTSTWVAPKIATRLAIAPKLSMETRVRFAEWNGRAALFDDAAVETRFRAQTPLPLVREIESSIRRSPDGSLSQRIGFGLIDNLGLVLDAEGRIRLRTQAVFEQTVGHQGNGALVSGLQASLSGFAAAAGAVENRLSLKYEAREGQSTRRRGTVAYHRAWRVNPFLRLSLECELVSAAQTDGRLSLGWQAEF
jgi:hypothetical protein